MNAIVAAACPVTCDTCGAAPPPPPPPEPAPEPVPVPGPDPCLFGPCLHDGTCTQTHGGFECTCVGPWSGTTCSTSTASPEPDPGNDLCLNVDCSGHGSCTAAPEPSCECRQGFGNPPGDVLACVPQLQPACDSAPCLNNGTCQTVGDRYSCTCASGWIGPNCHQADGAPPPPPCAQLTPCTHGGTCADDPNSPAGYVCTCTSLYRGDTCQTNVASGPSPPATTGGPEPEPAPEPVAQPGAVDAGGVTLAPGGDEGSGAGPIIGVVIGVAALGVGSKMFSGRRQKIGMKADSSIYQSEGEAL